MTFRREFWLDDAGEVYPAGTYGLITAEVPLENVPFVSYRHVSTQICLRKGTTMKTLTIGPRVLKAALARDG